MNMRQRSMEKRTISFWILIFCVCVLNGCSFVRYLVIKGKMESGQNMSIRIVNSEYSKDTVISIFDNEFELKESVKDGQLTVVMYNEDKPIKKLIARTLKESDKIEIQLFDEEKKETDEIELTKQNLNDDFEWTIDMDYYNVERDGCDENEWIYRTYKYAEYGEIQYPEEMDLMVVKSIISLFENGEERPIAFLGAGKCDRLFSKRNNRYAKNEYGAEFYRKDAKNICRMRHSGYGCDTMDVVVADFGNSADKWIVDKWWRVYEIGDAKQLGTDYKIHTITRKNGDWIIVK